MQRAGVASARSRHCCIRVRRFNLRPLVRFEVKSVHMINSLSVYKATKYNDLSTIEDGRVLINAGRHVTITCPASAHLVPL